MAAHRQIHSHHFISWFENREINCSISLRTRVWLNIHIVHTKQFFGSVDCQLFYLIYHFTSAVITSSRVAFRIFVGEYTSHGFHHVFGYKIFRSDEFYAVCLSLSFFFNEFENRVLHFLDLFSPKLQNSKDIFVTLK